MDGKQQRRTLPRGLRPARTGDAHARIEYKKIVLTPIGVDGRNGCVGKSVIDLCRDEG
jgi:hypothetical protein